MWPWLVVTALIGIAIAVSVPRSGMPEGKSGSYLGRSVNDGAPAGEAQRALGSRVGTQRY